MWGIALIQGRAFGELDRADAHRVAIVNRVFADRFFVGPEHEVSG